jgi:hypothetical protein
MSDFSSQLILRFAIAAGIYRRQNNSFWKPLAICGLNREWLYGQEARAWAAGLRVLLQRAAEELPLAQTSRLEWQSGIGLVPFEPDILAALIGFCIRDRNRSEIRHF